MTARRVSGSHRKFFEDKATEHRLGALPDASIADAGREWGDLHLLSDV